MSRILEKVLGRLPIGWLQLVHNRARLGAAVAGVAFATVLVFVQLGVLGALNATIVMPYEQLDADVMLSAADASTLTEGSNLPRHWMHRALSHPAVVDAAPLYVGAVDWSLDDGSTTTLQVLAMAPVDDRFLDGALAGRLSSVKPADTALVDTGTRGVDPETLRGIGLRAPLELEANGLTLDVVGTFTIGSGFTADGYLVVSDQTFFRLFPRRSSAAPSHILLHLAPGADPDRVVADLKRMLPEQYSRIRSLADAAEEDRRYQTTERPVGVIFGFGVVMGVMVGLVIVYQILATDVADHLSEYATFKAMGYGHRFFLGIVFEEAVILAFLGFVPGFAIATAIYALLTGATGLPVAMDVGRAIAVFVGTVLSCVASGAIATRRLRGAEPADLF